MAPYTRYPFINEPMAEATIIGTPTNPLRPWQILKQIAERAKKLTRHELLRSTLVSPGAKLLIAATAKRAYRNRRLGALMHCCAAWDPVGECFEEVTFECTNFHELSQIIASLTRENIAEREAAVHNLPWTHTEKDNALARCRISQRACAANKPMPCLHAVTDEEGRPLDDEDESGTRLCT